MNWNMLTYEEDRPFESAFEGGITDVE